ncbi:MAG TPA: excinuclease ABC subunit UvrB [Candidatus Methylacidiphilales bacterium]|jgi:excinuclease ABC subunit B|nr:excinuclease ABC subunit UvrB [Candidatus Methylacidiphilales bacterium]
MPFNLVSPYPPLGDQPQAIDKLLKRIRAGEKHSTLLGVTGSGKTFTMANVIAALDRPTLVLSHNKTLAAQLYSEFKQFFPDNAVEYFVSYFDYYQPEAYIPRSDTYIEKDSSINEEIERLRLAATSSLLTRRDVIVVASVSCIYGLGSPDDYKDMVCPVAKGQFLTRENFLARLVEMQYERNDFQLTRGKFRVRGDTIELCPAYTEDAVRVEFFGDEIDRLTRFDPISGETQEPLEQIVFFAARHYVTPADKMRIAMGTIRAELDERLAELEKMGKLLEAQRLKMRTTFDLEMMEEMGFCNGIENYSRHTSGRAPGSRPFTLIDFFPKDFLAIIDESHVAVPQIGGMYEGDRSRKTVLVEHGFRLPSALDNRPLKFEEFDALVGQRLYVSATPSKYEIEKSDGVTAEQVIRPTGLLDPEIVVKPLGGQVDDLIEQARLRVGMGERVLVTTLTKRTAEDLADYLRDLGVKVRYIHSEIDTIERVEILRSLRTGEVDVLIGINLLREGLDLPEVSLVAVLDADKEGFLRSQTSLIQTAGRAARHLNGLVILYADTVTESIRQLIAISKARREKQIAYNKEHGITPRSVVRAVQESLGNVLKGRQIAANIAGEGGADMDVTQVLQELENEMLAASASMHYEKAALLRDQIMELKQQAGLDKIEPKQKVVTYQKPARGTTRKPAKKI